MSHNSKVLADTVNIKPLKDPKKIVEIVNYSLSKFFFSQTPRRWNGELEETSQVSKHELTYTRIVPSAY